MSTQIASERKERREMEKDREDSYNTRLRLHTPRAEKKQRHK
jgi:hypothetical protein